MPFYLIILPPFQDLVGGCSNEKYKPLTEGSLLPPYNHKLLNTVKLGLSGLGILNGMLGIYSIKGSKRTTENEYATQEAYTNVNPYATQEAYTTENKYATEEAYASENKYVTEEVYASENKYVTEEPYVIENKYVTEVAYTTVNKYAMKEAYNTENKYATEEAYTHENKYATEVAYTTENNYATEEAYTPENKYTKEKAYNIENKYEEEAYTNKYSAEEAYGTNNSYNAEEVYDAEKSYITNWSEWSTCNEGDVQRFRTKGTDKETELCLKQEDLATVLIGGCAVDIIDPELHLPIAYHPQTLTCGIPNSPFTSCVRQAGAFINNSVVICGQEDKSGN